MINGKVQIDDQLISYQLSSDKEEDPLILLLHGSNQSHKVFIDMIQSDDLKSFRFLSFDFPGAPESPLGNHQEISIPALASLTLKLLQFLKVKSVFAIVGLSLGGHIAIQIVKELETKGIFLISCAPIEGVESLGDSFKMNEVLTYFTKETLTSTEIEAMATALSSKHTIAVQNDIRQTSPHFRKKMGESFSSIQFNDEIQILKSFNKPIEFVFSKEDCFLQSSYIRGLKNKLTLSTIKETLGAHLIPLDRPTEIKKYLSSFLKRI